MPTAEFPEYLTIGTYIIGTQACFCTNLKVLHSTAQRGSDRLVPGSAGIVGNPRRLAPSIQTLELRIFGDVDADGAPTADAMIGLDANIEALKAAVAPVDSGDGTRSVTWTRPGGSVSADCHVGPLSIGEQSGFMVFATLDIQVDAGAWT